MLQPKSAKALRLTPRQALLAAGVVALAGLLYLPTLSYDFVWDDRGLITENRDLLAPAPFAFFGQSFTHWWANQGRIPHQYYRPLVISSFWLDQRLSGPKPLGFHLTNVLLNCGVGVLVVLVLAEMLASFWPVLLGGLAFALHPTHVESVAFVADRTDLMMTLFVLLAFLALLRYRRRPSIATSVLTVVPFAAALLCKETAILFPVLAFFLLLPELRQPARRRRALVLVGAMAAVVVVYLAARVAALTGTPPSWGDVGPGMRFMLAVNAFGRYALLAVVPFDRRIRFTDPRALAAFGWPTVAAVIALAGLAWMAVRFRRQPAGVGSLWFFLFMLPACNLVPPGPSYLSQRMLYLPTVGAVLVSAAWAVTLRRGRRVLAALAVLYVGVMGLSAARSMPVWRNERSLDTTIIAQSPDDRQARFDLVRVLQESSDWQGAAREVRRGLALVPGDTSAWVLLGDVLAQEGDFGGAAAAYRQALGLDPNAAMVHNNLGAVLNQVGDPRGAEDEYRQAVRLQPDLAMAHNNLGQLMALRGRQDSALVEFRQALQSQPDNTRARFNLGMALQALGRMEEARAAFEQVLGQDPGFPGAAERLRALPGKVRADMR
jgi:protein O-mannosyl-transferase